MSEQTIPGLHPQVAKNLRIFSEQEQAIVRKLASEWYVTRSSDLTIGGNSEYRYILIKATKLYQDMFNFERELIVIFSSYDNFQPRSIDAIDFVIDNVLSKVQALRIERICSVILSKDEQVEAKIRNILKESQESQVIIPISYSEIINNNDSFFLRNKFRKNFYTRDLFDFESPLKKDLYFFGRTNLINRIVNRHSSNENSGLFGLRKAGKTSVIFGVQRALDKIGAKSVLISCDDTSFQFRRWNKCFYYIIAEIAQKYNLNIKLKPEDKYTEENAGLVFEEQILKIHRTLQNQNILIIFDEIERITFDISTSQHWGEGLDFIFFWQTLRAKFQKLNRIFSYLIVGTNPMGVEKPTIRGKDNPIFNSVPIEYLERFDVPHTREMVRKLGKLMGLKFDETIYSKLTEDYGGHPFLIRQVCSLIHKLNNQDLPITVNRIIYEKAKNEFDMNQATKYIEMMMSVLTEFYPDEYTMLQSLAIGEIELFKTYASDSPEYTNHLKGYGIIEQSGDEYDFKIDAVQKYLIQKNKYKKLSLSDEEMRKEISERRNRLEINLRKVIRNQLKATYGENEAREKLIKMGIFDKKYSHLSYKDLFDPNKNNIYFDNLRAIVKKEWQIFENIFLRKQEDFNTKMTAINQYSGSSPLTKRYNLCSERVGDSTASAPTGYKLRKLPTNLTLFVGGELVE